MQDTAGRRQDDMTPEEDEECAELLKSKRKGLDEAAQGLSQFVEQLRLENVELRRNGNGKHS